MVKRRKIYLMLGKTQKRIIIHLAEKGPSNIKRIAVNLGLEYAYTHTTIKSLCKQKILGTVFGVTAFTQYWLMPRGVIHVLEYNVNPDDLLLKIKNVIKKNAKGESPESLRILLMPLQNLCAYSKYLGAPAIKAIGEAVMAELDDKGEWKYDPFKIRTIPLPTVIKKDADIRELYNYLIKAGIPFPDLKELEKFVKALMEKGILLGGEKTQ